MRTVWGGRGGHVQPKHAHFTLHKPTLGSKHGLPFCLSTLLQGQQALFNVLKAYALHDMEVSELWVAGRPPQHTMSLLALWHRKSASAYLHHTYLYKLLDLSLQGQ